MHSSHTVTHKNTNAYIYVLSYLYVCRLSDVWWTRPSALAPCLKMLKKLPEMLVAYSTMVAPITMSSVRTLRR